VPHLAHGPADDLAGVQVEDRGGGIIGPPRRPVRACSVRWDTHAGCPSEEDRGQTKLSRYGKARPRHTMWMAGQGNVRRFVYPAAGLVT
jgi:hypothetical protein